MATRLTDSHLTAIFGVFSTPREYILNLYDTYHPYAEIVGIVLGLIALAFAFKQLGDSQRLLSEMSTQFVNVFPYNLSAIVELMEKASSSVDIMVDIVGYGHYSAPEEFTKYQNKLNEFAHNDKIRLRMLVYGKRLTARTRDEQFGGPNGFAEIRKSMQFRRYFRDVHKGYAEPQDYNSFIKILDEKEQTYEKEAKGFGASIYTSDEPFRFFLWLIDDAEAAFSFQTYGEHFDEVCFRTRDGHLIKTFTRLFRDAWAELEKSNGPAQGPEKGEAPAATPAHTTPPLSEPA